MEIKVTDVLKDAVDAAKKKNISTIVIASTSGETASNLLDLIGQDNLRVIVVTHDEGKPESGRRFNEDIRRKLLAHNITVYTHNPRMILLRKIIARVFGRFGFPRWYEHLKQVKDQYGTGIKVCHIIVHMLLEGNVLTDDRVIAIAGTKRGADSSCAFAVKRHGWPMLEDIIARP